MLYELNFHSVCHFYVTSGFAPSTSYTTEIKIKNSKNILGGIRLPRTYVDFTKKIKIGKIISHKICNFVENMREIDSLVIYFKLSSNYQNLIWFTKNKHRKKKLFSFVKCDEIQCKMKYFLGWRKNREKSDKVHGFFQTPNREIISKFFLDKESISSRSYKQHN